MDDSESSTSTSTCYKGVAEVKDQNDYGYARSRKGHGGYEGVGSSRGYGGSRPDKGYNGGGLDKGYGAKVQDAVGVVIKATNDTSVRVFDVDGGALLGLLNLVIDGQGKSAGIFIDSDDKVPEDQATITTKDVTLQHFFCDDSSRTNRGCALAVDVPGNVIITRTSFLHNTCEGNVVQGCALYLDSSIHRLAQVRTV